MSEPTKPNPLDKIVREGDEARQKYIEQALHANDEAASGAKMSDLFNKDSSVYQSGEVKPKPEVKEAPPKPTHDAEGFPIMERVHTYREDLADIVNSDKLSLSRIAMMQDNAAQNNKSTESAPQKPKFNILTIISTILIILSMVIIGLVFWLESKGKAPVKTEAPAERYIILSEDRELVDIDKITKTEVTASIRSTTANFKEEDSVKEIIPVTNVSGAAERASLQALLDKTNAKLPDSLKRNLYSGFFLGLYSEKGVTYPFLITFVDSYDIAFAGMLEWEGFMRDDLSWLFDTKPRQATTTLALSFKDRIIANKDARSFEDASGKTAFFYTFLDSHTLLFAKSAGTVREVTDRLRQAKFQ